MIVFPDPNVETEYTDPNGAVWEFNGTGWVRQCESSGGDAGEGYWPTIKPSVDLFAFPGGITNWNGMRAADFYKVEGDGTLSFYDRIEDAGTIGCIKFARTRPIVMLAFNERYAKFYDYSTSPMTLVHELDMGNGNGFSFSASDRYILHFDGKKAKAFRESSPGASDWSAYGPETFIVDEDETNAYLDSMGITDPEERLSLYSMHSPGSFPRWADEREPLFFAVADIAGTTSPNVYLIEATGSGPALVSKGHTRGWNTAANTSYGAQINSASEGHPHLSMFAYGAAEKSIDNMDQELTKWSAGLVNCNGLHYKDIYGGAKLAPRRHRNGKAFGPDFSPSGNYLCIKQHESSVSIFRVQGSGDIDIAGVITLTSNSAGYRGAWSADEKFFYLWARMGQDSVTGDQGKIIAYSFNNGTATLIGDTGVTTRGYPSEGNGASGISRSKF